MLENVDYENLKNLTFRELIMLSTRVETQKQLDFVDKELASRPFWMNKTTVYK